MTQVGQPPENRPQELSGCFCVVIGFICGNILFACLHGWLSAFVFGSTDFYKVQMGTSRSEVISLMGKPKAELSANPVPSGYYHQDASRSGARQYLVWRSRRGASRVVGLDAEGNTVFKCIMND